MLNPRERVSGDQDSLSNCTKIQEFVRVKSKKGVGGASWLGRYSEQRSEDLLCQAVKATQCGLDITLLIRGFGRYSCW